MFLCIYVCITLHTVYILYIVCAYVYYIITRIQTKNLTSSCGNTIERLTFGHLCVCNVYKYACVHMYIYICICM